jgi:hypothetical protein
MTTILQILFWILMGAIFIALAACVASPFILSGRISDQEEREEERRKAEEEAFLASELSRLPPPASSEEIAAALTLAKTGNCNQVPCGSCPWRLSKHAAFKAAGWDGSFPSPEAAKVAVGWLEAHASTPSGPILPADELARLRARWDTVRETAAIG